MPHALTLFPQLVSSGGYLAHLQQRLTGLQAAVYIVNSSQAQLGMPVSRLQVLDRCNALLTPFQMLLTCKQVRGLVCNAPMGVIGDSCCIRSRE